ncbi:hypothetical protein LJR296_006967 [Cupriavidus necator]
MKKAEQTKVIVALIHAVQAITIAGIRAYVAIKVAQISHLFFS